MLTTMKYQLLSPPPLLTNLHPLYLNIPLLFLSYLLQLCFLFLLEASVLEILFLVYYLVALYGGAEGLGAFGVDVVVGVEVILLYERENVALWLLSC